MEDKNKNIEHHKKLEEIINTNSNDYITDLILQIKKISTFFKKISLINQKNFSLESNEYKNLHEKTIKKLENLILKFFKIIYKNPENKIIFSDYKNIINGVDDLLEKVSDNIDIIKGIKKEKKDEDILNELKNINEKESNIKESKKIYKLNENDDFDIDNSYYSFIPKINIKYNFKEPLDNRILDAKNLREKNKEKLILKYSDSKNKNIQKPLFDNPYLYEIQEFINEEIENLNSFNTLYNNSKNKINFIEILTTKDKEDYLNNKNPLNFYIQKFKNLNETPLNFIDNTNLLNNLLDKLKNCKEIAIDLEHHSKESYLGITCLLQLSTREEDYIIDALKLRKELNILNEIFTNPSILKVFHGGDYDIEWLQKDFGLYVVNMFDTGQASRVLQMPSYALKYLLNEICDYEADKKYQLADWRIRPLSKEMINYARGDTHFLLYIYDILKQKLIMKSLENNINDPINLYIQVFKKSNEITMKSYQKPMVKSPDYLKFIAFNSGKNHRELGLMKEIYIFRDYLARKLDLNPDLIFNKITISKLAKLKEFNEKNILFILNNKSPLMRYLKEFIEIINNKLERIKKKEKEKINDLNKREKEYIEKVKKLINKNNENNNNNENKIHFSNNLNLEEHRKNFEEYKKNCNIDNNNLIKNNLNSKFLTKTEINNNKFNSINNNEINNFLKEFNLINYLKNKHNIGNIEIKLISDNNENILNKKRENSKSNNDSESEEEKSINEKIKKMRDITDNERIYKELKEQYIDNKKPIYSEDEEEESNEIDDIINIEKEKNKSNYKNLYLNNKLKNFESNLKNNRKSIYEYKNEYKYHGKRKKK